MFGEKSLTRRSVLGSWGAGGIAAALGNILSGKAAHGQDEGAKALALVGDRWHSFDYIRTAMNRTFVDGLGLSIDYTSDSRVISEETLKKYTLLIMLMDGMIFPNGYKTPYHLIDPSMELVSEPPVEGLNEKHDMWIQPSQGKALRAWVENGGAALFYHNCNYISSANEDYRHVEGALFTGHTKFKPYTLEVTQSTHPITQGVSDFVVTEEQHYLIYDKDPADVFLRSRSMDNESYKPRRHPEQVPTCEAGWAYDYGRGRVCYLAPGHTIPTLWNPEYEKLQKNAVRWLMKEL